MSVKNELIYDPLTYANTNYDKTEHRGIESEIEFKPMEKLTFSAGYTLTEAFFEGGVYNNNQIPMVPRHKIFTSVSFSPGINWQIDTTARYISKQYFINDQAHLYSPLKEFVTFDSKLSYNLKNASFYIGINNLFDERYSEFGAISTVYNEKGYYPAPGRNFFIGASLKF
jgi:iron complex outermembrane receptor protein